MTNLRLVNLSSRRDTFEVARNLALYSWFVYSFYEVAAMQALASLEMCPCGEAVYLPSPAHRRLTSMAE